MASPDPRPVMLEGANLSENRYPDLNWHPSTHPVMTRGRLTSGYPSDPAWQRARPAALLQNARTGTAQSINPVPRPNDDVPLTQQQVWLAMLQQQRQLQQRPQLAEDPSFSLDQLAAIQWLHGIPLSLDDILALRERRTTPFELCRKYNPQMAMMLRERWSGNARAAWMRRYRVQPREGTAPPVGARSGLSREVLVEGRGGLEVRQGGPRTNAEGLVRPAAPDPIRARRVR